MSDDLKLNVSGKIPKGLSTWQNSYPNKTSFFGKTISNDENYESIIFGIHNNDRKGHFLITGKNFTGKTMLLNLLIRQDYVNENPFIVISNNNANYLNFKNYLKNNKNIAENKILLFDPLNEDSMVFNWFADCDDKNARRISDILSQILKKQLNNTWNDRLEFLLRQLILTITLFNDNLYSAFKILSSSSFRNQYLEKISNHELALFWREEYPEWEKQYMADVIIPLKNRLEKLVNDPLLKTIFETKNTENIENILSENNFIFISLAKNEIGQDDADILRGIIMSHLIKISTSYNNNNNNNNLTKNEIKKKDCQIYFDDYPSNYFNLMSRFISLTEANKFVINLTLSSLFSENEELNLFLINFKNLLTFKLTIEDAQKLKGEFSPEFDTRDLSSLPDRHFIAKLFIQQKQSIPILGKILDVIN